MKNLSTIIIILMILIAFVGVSFMTLANEDTYAGSMTQDAIQQNTASNSPTSIMQNTQLNGGTTFDSYGGGVTCSRATMQMGAIGNVKGQYRQGAQLYVGVSIPIGSGSDCKSAARTQIGLNRQRMVEMQQTAIRVNEAHVENIKRTKLMYQDLLAKVCLNHHGKLSAAIESPLLLECDSFKSLEHNELNHRHQEVEGYERISGHHK